MSVSESLGRTIGGHLLNENLIYKGLKLLSEKVNPAFFKGKRLN